MWQSRTKTDLMIEVWEKLDCESVGAAEIEAIEIVVRDTFGQQAVDSPMSIARLLADEGADLRHSEVMELHIARAQDRPYEAVFVDIFRADDLAGTMDTIRSLEQLRVKYRIANDKEGLRLVREHALAAKLNALETAQRVNIDPFIRQTNKEIAEWLTVWLQTPEIFENWVTLRRQNPNFIDMFGRIRMA